MASPVLARLAAAVLTSEKGRKTVGWVIALILSPTILLVAFLCCFGTAAVEHNDFAVSASFYGPAFSDKIPAEYKDHISEMRTAFTLLDAATAAVNLGGKELTSAGHLSAQNFSFSDEVMMENGKLNFYVQADFDVDAAFGTFVCTDENDDWLNIYANYDIMRDRPCDTLELNLCKGDGTEENWSYHLNAAEQEVLARKMEAFCQQQNGMSLRDFARQLQEEPGPSQQIQM